MTRSPNPRSLPPVGHQPATGTASRVAVLSDVHGNVLALQAVLEEVAGSGADLVVFTGDLTWGPEPLQTIDIVRRLGTATMFVRGNADRVVGEVAAEGTADGEPARAVEAWMAAAHSQEALDFLAGFTFSTTVTVDGLGPVRFCHGSPRSDEEVLTAATPPARLDEVFETVAERVLVHGHTHIQYQRVLEDGRRVLNPGSVGLPYHRGVPGTAYWAVLGPGVELRQTRYDVEGSIRRSAAAGYPNTERNIGLLRRPPLPEEVVAEAEPLVYSG